MGGEEVLVWLPAVQQRNFKFLIWDLEFIMAWTKKLFLYYKVLRYA